MNHSIFKRNSSVSWHAISNPFRWSIISLSVLLLSGTVFGARPAVAESPGRLIVKFKEPLARRIEKALPPVSLELENPGRLVRPDWFEKFQIKKLKPLYPELVRTRMRTGLSDRQMTERVRGHFPTRANRVVPGVELPKLSPTYSLEVHAGSEEELERIIASLQADPEVEYAQREQILEAQFTPQDPYFSSTGSWGQTYADLYGVKLIGCPAAWDSTSGQGVVVAVVDTGIDYNHPDLANNIWLNADEITGNGYDDDGNGFVDDARGWDFTRAGNNPMDGNGHGTHVAGTIAAVAGNGLDVVGVAWGAKIMAVRALDNDGYGTDTALANAIIYAADNGADVINNSYGGTGSSPVMLDAVNYAYGLGVVVVAAAGNNSSNAKDFFPACFAASIAVTATDASDQRANFSNWGDRVDVAAPGVDVLSLRASGTTMGIPLSAELTRASGTSMAAPHVSALAALILGRHPDYSPEQVRQTLRISAKDVNAAGVDVYTGYGRINASNAVAAPLVLEARIQTPESESVITEPVTLYGAAQGPNFSSYTLELGTGDSPVTWTVLQQSATPVNGGALGVIDAPRLPDGRYTIRLRSLNQQGMVFEDRIKLVVDGVSITSPAATAPAQSQFFKPGTVVPIWGKATGASFQSFRLEWARGQNPTNGWTALGMTAVNGGRESVAYGFLGQWDTSVAAQADYYSIRLSVANAGFTSQDTVRVYLEPDLLSANWPKQLDYGPLMNNSVMPQADAMGNISLRLSASDWWDSPPVSKLWKFSPDGSGVTTNFLSAISYCQPPVGNLDGNLAQELVGLDTYQFRVFHADDSSYTFSLPSVPYCNRSIRLLQDLDGDGAPELVFVSTWGLQKMDYLYALNNGNQTLTTNYPATFTSANTDLSYFALNRVLAADLDGDGRKEILAVQGDAPGVFSFKVFNWDGTPRPWSTQVYSGRFSEWVATDFERDGKAEIVVSYLDYSRNNDLQVAVLLADGSVKPGWPVTVPSGRNNASCLALGDLDGDGVDEIVVTAEQAFDVFKFDGTPLNSSWPKSVGFVGPVSIGDINGDGFPEILAMREGTDGTRLAAWDRNGNELRSWLMPGAPGGNPYYGGTVVIGDFQGDGRVDLAVSYPLLLETGQLSCGMMTVLGLNAPYDPAANHWPMNLHDPQNSATRILPPDRTPPSVAVTSPAANAVISNVVSIAAAASDNVKLVGVQFQLDGAKLGLEDTSAPYGLSLDPRTVPSGPHTLRAVARDLAGNVTTSAPLAVTVQNVMRVNFQPASAPTYTNCLVDAGAVFGTRANSYSYGWNLNNASHVYDRNNKLSPDQRYDTLAAMQSGGTFTWEIAVPNGNYQVRAVAGDPNNFNSIYRINVEGLLTVNGTPSTGKRWIEGTAQVKVADGRLTLSNATGSNNNKICFVEITPVF